MSGEGHSNLTPRQWRILGLLAEGRSVPTVARALGMTPGAVRVQLVAIYRALPLEGVASKRPAAVAWYLREGHRYREGAGS